MLFRSSAEAVEDALTEMESSQLTAVASSHGSDLAVSLMLSFRDAPPVRLNWRREGSFEEYSSRPFIVDLEMNMAELGAMWLRTRIIEGSGVEMIMWAEREDVAQLARQHSSELRLQLQEAGLRVLSMQVIHGIAPRDESPLTPTRVTGQWVDIKT